MLGVSIWCGGMKFKISIKLSGMRSELFESLRPEIRSLEIIFRMIKFVLLFVLIEEFVYLLI